MGGVVATLVGDTAPERIRRLVYLAALAPSDGASVLDVYGATIDFEASGLVLSDDGSSIIVPTMEAATSLFYGDCDPDDARWAYERLVPQPIGMFVEPLSLQHFDEVAVPRTYILCGQDGAIPPDLQRSMAARLGVVPIELDTAHSPWLNRPADVARVIIDVGA
jgi:pimeloyl-ACP methyl ester carboxylesterase